MNTICKFTDIDTYLLYFIDLSLLFTLTTISKDQNKHMFNLDFVKELHIIVQKYGYKNIIDNAAKHNYVSVLNWLADTKYDFKYFKINYNKPMPSRNGYIDLLNRDANSIYVLQYFTYAIDEASAYGARIRSQ